MVTVLGACGGAEGRVAEDAEASLDTLSAALTTGRSRGCDFSFSVSERPGVIPPIRDVQLHRAASDTCPWGPASQWVGSSHGGLWLSMAANELGVAIGINYKISYSGSSPYQLSIQHVDPETMATVRSDFIHAYNADYGYSGELSIAADGTTLVCGGLYYPDFFTSTTPRTRVAP